MRREDFKVEGIPDGYEVRGVDLTSSGRPVCVLAHRGDSTRELFLLFTDSMRPIPDDAVLRLAHISHVSIPIVRCIDEERVLLYGTARRDAESNARILNRAGDVEHSFHLGGPSEVLANENWIVTHYSDQAMTSDDYPVDREGLAVFDATGTFLWGFDGQFAGEPRLDVFHHAAVWIGANEIGVYRDIDRGLKSFEAFIRLDLRERSHQVWRLPREAFLSSAMSVVGDRVILYSPVAPTPILGIPLSPPEIVRWWKVKPVE